jgi:hypothetical protein
VETDGDGTLFGEPLAATGFSLFNGKIGTDEAPGSEVPLVMRVTGEVVRAGLPVEDPILDTLGCLLGIATVAGAGRGPSPSNDAGFVAAATAEAYLSSVGGLFDCDGGFGTPFVTGTGGAVAVVDVTIGRLVATLARRLGGTTGSLILELISSFRGVCG